MTGRQKILLVLKEIKRESEINPNPEWVEFRFNTSVIGLGILTDDQEKRILMKMEKDGIIEIHLPDVIDNDQDAMLSTYTPTEFMMESNSIWVKILPPFYRRYFWYSLISLTDNKWNYVNPFWILWKLIQCFILIVDWLWNKSKIITIIIVFSGLLVYDWISAWKNIKIIFSYFRFS